MPSERVLVGGGISYDNTQVSATYQPYYKFTTSDNYVWNTDIVYSSTSYSLIDGTPRNKHYVNNLFTGVLPYQNSFDSSYYKYSLLPDRYQAALSNAKAYFNFGLPVVLTKYRMYNAFATNVIGNLSYDNLESDMGNQTPQDWNLAGTNDGITWTTIDSRTNQAKFPNATSRLAKNCSYSEYTIAGASAYKAYRLIVTLGGRTASSCDKSGCLYKSFQIGEMQLWGYESPDTPCELHGGYTLFPTVKYLNSSGTTLAESFNMGSRVSSFARAFSNFGFRFRRGTDDASFPNGNSGLSPLNNYNAMYYSGWGPFGWTPVGNIAGIGYVDFGVGVTLSSYNMTSGGGSAQFGNNSRIRCIQAWTLYGSNNNSTWTTIDNRSGITNNNISTISNYAIASPSSYRYYKIEIKDGAGGYTGKSGSFYDVVINSLQFIGCVS
jgi:hypothetical protein